MHQLLKHIRKKKFEDDFLYPYYQGYSIVNIVQSILQHYELPITHQPLAFPTLLDQAQKSSSIVFFMIDGLAYHHLVKFSKRSPFFNRFSQRGMVYPITSVFPSTTAAALTAFHTGLTPQEHGLPEWSVYFEEFDRIIETLPFRTPGTVDVDGMLQLGGRSEMLYSGETIYEKLGKKGIPSYMFLYQPLANTAYSNAVHKGSAIIPFADGHDLMQKVAHQIRVQKTPSYYFVYWGSIDSIAHHFGADSTEHTDAIMAFSSLMQDVFLSELRDAQVDDTLILFSADHGHVNIKGEDIINLNIFQVIEENFALGRDGRKILPTGSPHDVFLYIQKDKITEVVETLRTELTGFADVITTKEALEKGLFGMGPVSDIFLKRIGDVLILPYNHYHIWYEFLAGAKYPQLGIHGGLSQEEMIVPLGIARLADLIQN